MDKNKIVFQQQEEVAFHQLKEQIQDVKFYNSQFYRNYSWDKSALSVECYCTITGTSYSSYSWQYPFSIGGANGIGFEYLKGISNSYYTVRIYILGTGKDFTSPYFNLGSYSHVVVSYDGAGTANVYINGALVGSVSGSNDKDLSNSFLSVGSSQITPTNQLNGNVRILRVFNYALSATEVTQLYNNGKPEEYVLPSTLKQINTTPRNYDGQVMSYTWDDTHTEYYYYPPCNNKEKLPKDTLWKVVVELSNYVDGRPFVLTGDYSGGYGWIPRANGIYTFYLKGDGVNNTVGLYMSKTDTGGHLTLTLMSVSQVGCIAEYLPQNLITAHDGQMYDITPIQWLDSAKQLPINDQYLPPLRGSIGEYDLTASGTPEIVQKPILTRVINAKLTTGYDGSRVVFNTSQIDSTVTIINNKAICNCGSEVIDNRPICAGALYPFIIGKKYRVTTKYTLIKGDVHLHGIGNWQTDAYQVVQSTYDTEIKQYSWDSGIIPYDQASSTYKIPYLYFGNSVPNSEFSIDEMTIYEYN